MNDFNFMKVASSILAGPVGLLVLVFFFLPWITISCSTQGFGPAPDAVKASGFELATGDAYDEVIEMLTGSTAMLGDLGSQATGSTSSPSPSDEVPAELKALDTDPTLWLIPLAGLIALVVAGLRFFMPVSSIIAGGTYLLVGIVGLGVQIMKYFDLRDLEKNLEKPIDAATPSLIRFSFNDVWWYTMIGLGLLIVAGLVAILFETIAEDSPPTFSPE